MSDAVTVALIATAGPTLISLLTLANQFIIAKRAEEVRMHIVGKIQEQKQDMQKIETATNGMKEALIKAAEKAGLAEGIKQGLQQAEDAKGKQGS